VTYEEAIERMEKMLLDLSELADRPGLTQEQLDRSRK
jgi:hypothetical protein